MNDLAEMIRYVATKGGVEMTFSRSSVNGDSDRLGESLPAILEEEDSTAAWLQLFGTEKVAHQYLKDLLVRTEAPAKFLKATASMPIERYTEILTRYFSIPLMRNFKPEQVSRNSFTEVMMSKLLQFDEYKNYKLEDIQEEFHSVLFSDRGSLFTGDFNPFAELATFSLIDDEVLKRIIRVSKLQPYLKGFNQLPQKQKNDLVLGIFGLFDHLGSEIGLVTLLECFEDLISEYSSVPIIERMIQAKSSGEYSFFKIKLLTDQMIASEDISCYEGIQQLTQLDVYQENVLEQSGLILRESIEDYNEIFGNNKKHLFPNSSLPEVDIEGVIKGLSAKAMRFAAYDIKLIFDRLEGVIAHPFLETLHRKEDEKHSIADALKALDPTDIAAAMALVEKVKSLCASITDAPAELKAELDLTQRLYARFMEKYPSAGQVHEETLEPVHFPEVIQPAVVEELPDKKLEAEKNVDAKTVSFEEFSALQKELKRVSGDLAASSSKNTKLEQANSDLDKKVREQKTELGKFRSKQHEIQATEVNKPVTYDGGFVKRIAEEVSKGIKNPEEMLRTFAALYPDRLVVLDSAYESAKASWEFKNLSRLGSLINILVTDYLRDSLNGVPDAQSRNLFGTKAFRANESDTVLANDKLRSSREFVYNGKKLVFERHLAIGISYGKADTIRLYFDVIDQKIIIAYCGEHLGNTRTS